MGQEWAGRTEPVRPVPSRPAREVDADVVRLAEQRQHYAEALQKFTERVAALPELGGATGSEQQFAELDEIHALLTTVMTWRSIVRARAHLSQGLFFELTGKPLPPYKPTGGADA